MPQLSSRYLRYIYCLRITLLNSHKSLLWMKLSLAKSIPLVCLFEIKGAGSAINPLIELLIFSGRVKTTREKLGIAFDKSAQTRLAR